VWPARSRSAGVRLGGFLIHTFDLWFARRGVQGALATRAMLLVVVPIALTNASGGAV
jgi:hypothetical protein